jgi:hypothetical protein
MWFYRAMRVTWLFVSLDCMMPRTNFKFLRADLALTASMLKVGAIVANVKTVHLVRFSLIACTALLPRSVAAALLLLSFSAARADLPPLAQEAFNKGITANSKADYAQAIVDFQDARKQSEAKGVFPTPEIYQKLGEVESKMPGRELRAICWFGAYLSANPQATDFVQIKAQIRLLDRISRDNISRLIQLTEDTGQIIASDERARHNVEGSLDDVVVLWDKFGDYSKAQKIANVIEDAAKRCAADGRISWTKIDAGDFVGAWETIHTQEKAAGSIRDSHWQASAWLDLILLESHMAMEQVKAGDEFGAQKSILAAKKTSEIIIANKTQDLFGFSYFLSQAYRSIAEAQAAAGDILGAKQTVDLIKGEDARADHKFDAQLAIADAQLKAGDREGARKTLTASGKTADLIPQADAKLEKRLALAKAQVKAGDGTGAREILATAVAELRKNGIKEPNAYYSLSLAQASGGDINGAKKTAKYIQNSDDKAALLDKIDQASKQTPAPAPKEHPLDPVYPWLWKLEGTLIRSERVPCLDDPLFTDYSGYMAALLKKDDTPEQKFSNLQRVAREMIDFQNEIDHMLEDQFKI